MVNMDFDTAKKKAEGRFDRWDHHKEPASDELVETQQEYISALEKLTRMQEDTISVLRMSRDYWQKRAEELEGNIDGMIDRTERELAETAFNDRNDAEAKRQIHGD